MTGKELYCTECELPVKVINSVLPMLEESEELTEPAFNCECMLVDFEFNQNIELPDCWELRDTK